MKKKIPDTNIFSSKLVFIGGHSKCGKSFLCPIVSSLKNSEMFICEPVSENIYYTYYLQKMDYDFAKFFLKRIYNERVHNLSIGRNLNKRINDYSSILNFKDPNIYFKRENSSAKQLYKNYNTKSFYPIMFHDVMLSPNILLDSFKNAKIIYIDRHPVDMIIEWEKNGYYGEVYSNKKNTTLSFKYKDKLYPYWWLGDEEKFSKINNNFEKIILSLEKIYIKQKKNFLRFKKKYPKKFFYVNFDEMTEKTDFTVKNISKFLNTKQDNKTNTIINKENGNRKIDTKDRLVKRDHILRQVSNKYHKIFINLEKIYEKTI